jgi:hypothetical protein
MLTVGMYEIGPAPLEGFHLEQREQSCSKWTVQYFVGAFKLPLHPYVEK